MKRVSQCADRIRQQSPVSQARTPSRRRTGYQAAIEELESRLPPGDMLAGAWWAASLAEAGHAPLKQDPNAVDWLHSNTVAWSPADRNLIISIRHQNWVVKINYDDGFGDGGVVWRLGANGDFTLDSPDPDPWFSYQHDSRYIDDATVTLYDNANSRCRGKTDCHSRGQLFALDEEARHATLVVNADLGHLSLALGSAQSLPGGNFVFTSGNLGPVSAPRGRSIETLADGTQTYVLEATTAWLYRTYRLRSLYEKTP